MTAERNGYFFVLDRVTGEHLVTGKFGIYTNWALGLDENGRPKRNPAKDATIPGSLVNADVTNYPPPAFSPQTGLFYVLENNALQITYLTDPDPRGSMGLGGTMNSGVISYGIHMTAIDYRTGKVAWRHEIAGNVGLLATAGGLVFGGDGQNFVAYEAAAGKPLWHSRIGLAGNAPETYMLDGKQWILATGEDQLFAFVLNK
jgi:alcohol dehydrogenase (cytochrome c)